MNDIFGKAHIDRMVSQTDDQSISRRGFLKTAATIGAALTVSPTLDKVKAAETVLAGARNGSTRKKDGMEYHTLDTGAG